MTFLLGLSLNANFMEIKTFSKNAFLQMVVEIPAGTNKKIEYDKNLNDFFIDKTPDYRRMEIKLEKESTDYLISIGTQEDA